MDDKIFQQQLQAAQFIAHVSSAQLQVVVQRFWEDELAKPRNADPKRLLRHGFKVYSQNDEDGIIQEIFKRIGTRDQTFIEFGVETGAECNTAKLLLEGWRGLWIEGAPQYANAIRRSLGSFISDKRLSLAEAMVTAENVNSLFSQAGFSGEIDLLSIDIDFNDYWVWKAVDVVKPRVVAIEYNPIFRPPMSLVVPYEPTHRWDGTNYGGASLGGACAAWPDQGLSHRRLQFFRRERFFRARRSLRGPFHRAGDGGRALRADAIFLCRAERPPVTFGTLRHGVSDGRQGARRSPDLPDRSQESPPDLANR